MARLIEIDDVQALSSPLTISTGDLLVVRASGGNVSTGETVIERLGPFITGFPQDDNAMLSPMGSPHTVMFLARHTGQATIEVAIGDPFFNPQLIRVAIHVDS